MALPAGGEPAAPVMPLRRPLPATKKGWSAQGGLLGTAAGATGAAGAAGGGTTGRAGAAGGGTATGGAATAGTSCLETNTRSGWMIPV